MSAPNDAPTPTAAAVSAAAVYLREALRAYTVEHPGPLLAAVQDLLRDYAALVADHAALLAQREADAGRVFSAAEMRAVLNYECWDGGNTNRPRAHEVEIYNDVRRRLREIEDRAHRAALARAATEAP